MVNETEEEDLDKKLSLTVEYQIKIRNFLRLVQSTLQYTSLLEVLGCTMIICFLGYDTIMGEKLALTVCTLAWYHLPNMKARSLILIIAISIVPMKLRAGKFFDLSIKTFSDVVKTALTYFNFIRKIL